MPEMLSSSASAVAFARQHLRRNFATLGTDYGFFTLGMTFASVSTIVPALAEHLGASNLVIGAIPSLMTLGHSLPALFTANHAERLPRKLGFILRVTIWERLPLLALAVLVFLYAESRPGLTALVMLLCIATISGIGGALMPAWMDLIGKVIPSAQRGWLFAYGSSLGTGLGLGGAALSGYFLEYYPYPANYSLCFAAGFACLCISFVSIALTTEPALASEKPAISMGAYLRRLPDILRTDQGFSWYLASRGLWMLGTAANGFYAVYGLRVLGAPEWEVAKFTVALLAGQTAANVAFGWVAGRYSHRVVLIIGAAAMVIGNGLALGSASVEPLYAVFVCLAVSTAAGNISAMNASLEFAPDTERPTYIGLAATLPAPLAFLAPLAGGLLADQVGYPAVFVAALAAGVVATWALVARVPETREGA
jgi:MFS family permease